MLSKVCIDTEILDVLTGSELKLFMIVESYNEGLGSYVSPNKISKDHNIPLRTVYNQIESLKQKGVLKFEKETINGSSVKVWKWDFANYGKNDENTDEQSDYQKAEKEIAKNGTVCSSSFNNKNTTTTYSAKNGKNRLSDLAKRDKTSKKESFAKNGKTNYLPFEDVNKLIHISESVFERAVSEYRIDEVKKAAVYVYQKKPRRPETYFLMTLKNKWYFDVEGGDFEKAVGKIEHEEELEKRRAKMAELKKIEEETQRRQAQLEREKIKSLEEKLANGEIDVNNVNFEGMNEFSRDRLNSALKKGNYRLAAMHLLPYMQMENVEVAV
jgi:hypothetical protein